MGQKHFLSGFVRKPNQVSCTLVGHREWNFHEHVFSSFQGQSRLFVVQFAWRGDHDGIDVGIFERIILSDCTFLVAHSGFEVRRRFFPASNNGMQAYSFDLAQSLGMKFRNATIPDHATVYCVHWLGLPVLPSCSIAVRLPRPACPGS